MQLVLFPTLLVLVFPGLSQEEQPIQAVAILLPPQEYSPSQGRVILQSLATSASGRRAPYNNCMLLATALLATPCSPSVAVKGNKVNPITKMSCGSTSSAASMK